ncbi:hypothetical protein [Paenarthrobacter ureafaciens]
MNQQAAFPPLTKAFMPIDGDFVYIPVLDDIQPGAEVMAVRHGELIHSGQVTDVMPEMGVFWILDNVSGGRKLVCWDEFRIFGRPSTPTDIPVVVKAETR